jgi:hypothetical protein
MIYRVASKLREPRGASRGRSIGVLAAFVGNERTLEKDTVCI